MDPKFMLPGKAPPLSLQSADQARQKDMIPGFVKAEEVVTPNVFAPPKVPADYQPIHHPFQQSLPGVLKLSPLFEMTERVKCTLLFILGVLEWTPLTAFHDPVAAITPLGLLQIAPHHWQKQAVPNLMK